MTTNAEQPVAATFRSPDSATPAAVTTVRANAEQPVAATFRSPNNDAPAAAVTTAATFRSPDSATPAAAATLAKWRRKKNRLPPDRYVGNAAYSLTLVTEGRQSWFKEEQLFSVLKGHLTRTAEASGFTLLAYVFMPDHLHVLAQGSDEASLPRFVKNFKQQTAFWFKRETGRELWQKSYYDHVLRREEDLNSVAVYVAENPVRAGLVVNWPDYHYWGGALLRALIDGDLKVAATPADDGEGKDQVGSLL